MTPVIPHLPASALHPFGGEASPRFTPEEVAALEDADRRCLWKPFTQMAGYVRGAPLVVAEGRGAWLRDVRGRVYLDGVSSLWVNVHGHRHPAIVAALRAQLDELDHSTLLGPSNVPAVRLAERLVALAPGDGRLSRVFFSDSGSTAVEIAVKMAFQFHAQHRDPAQRVRDVFVCLSDAYHGDTIGAVSVGGMDLFHRLYAPLLFSTVKTPAPDAFHRAFGRDAEEHEAECLTAMEAAFARHAGRVAALVMEPLVQGAAGMHMHSTEFLRGAAEIARRHGALLVLDEVATGFGRTGTMFACAQAGVTPDLLCVAKGLTGGVLPLAATLASEAVYAGFLGEFSELRTFFHGHSYTGNPLACAAALASLDVFAHEGVLARVAAAAARLRGHLRVIAEHPGVGEVRQRGLMVGIELVQDRRTGAPWDASLRMGHRVIERALLHGVLLRPLGDVVVLMPPLSITDDELDLLAGVTLRCVAEIDAEARA